MDTTDLKISRKLQKLMRKVDDMVRKECGPDIGVTLILHPYVTSIEKVRKAEFQYVSTMPREHMLGAMKSLITKWEAGVPDTPPHLRGQQ